MQPVEVYVDDESKLTLHGLVQHYTMLSEDGKNKRLMDLLDQLDFNQVLFCLVLFVQMPLFAICAHEQCTLISTLISISTFSPIQLAASDLLGYAHNHL